MQAITTIGLDIANYRSFRFTVSTGKAMESRSSTKLSLRDDLRAASRRTAWQGKPKTELWTGHQAEAQLIELEKPSVALADTRHARTNGGFRRCRTFLLQPRDALRPGTPAAAPRSQIGWLPRLWQSADNPSADFSCGYGWGTARPARHSQICRRL